jgi:enoyl-CoA hydratase/carnithine racemase
MVLTGEPIETDAALRWGLVDEVLTAHGLDAAVEARVQAALAGSPQKRRPQ